MSNFWMSGLISLPVRIDQSISRSSNSGDKLIIRCLRLCSVGFGFRPAPCRFPPLVIFITPYVLSLFQDFSQRVCDPLAYSGGQVIAT